MIHDKDLLSIQEVRTLLGKAKAAQRELVGLSQDKIDAIVLAVTRAYEQNAVRLAKMAQEETGFGKWEDKVLKNTFASRNVYEYIKDMKTVGIIGRDETNGVWEVAVPVGVVAALIPSTNPTSTVMFKTLISFKSGNAVVFSPHPGAAKCIQETVRVAVEALANVGAPENIVQCISIPTQEAVNELMRHKLTSLILATGGGAMVKAAYQSGTPAIGVGPGNGPAYIEHSADIPAAVRRIIESKTFDNGTICASEQSVIAEKRDEELVRREFKAQGGYFLTPEQSKRLEGFLFRGNGTMNPDTVGRSAEKLAQLYGIEVPAGTKVLLAEESGVGRGHPYSYEKLCPVLAFYTVSDWKEACELSIRLLENEGAGHTLSLHTQDNGIVAEFALRKPVSRILVNTPSALGGIGASTNLVPSLTLGCGAVGGSATSDNVGPMNLINIRRVAFGTRTLDELRQGSQAETESERQAAQYDTVSTGQVELITRLVLEKLQNKI